MFIDSGESENARSQLETAAQILESVRFEQRSPEAKQHLYDLQTKCYHLLQKILVSMNKNEEALVAAERCKSRTILDNSNSRKTLVTCSENIFEIVNKLKTNIIYFSLAEGDLYIWFLQPLKRIVRFHTVKINEINFPLHNKSENVVKSMKKEQILENYIAILRENLGVDSENVSELNDWRSSENLLDENLHDFTNERAGFLRMVNRNHLMNSSNYSLSSLFSLGSVGGSVASLQGSTRYVLQYWISFFLVKQMNFSYFIDQLEAYKDQLDQGVDFHCRLGKYQPRFIHSIIYCWLHLKICCRV